MSDPDLEIPQLDPLEVYRFSMRARYDAAFSREVVNKPIEVVRTSFGIELSEGCRVKPVELFTSEQLDFFRRLTQAVIDHRAVHAVDPDAPILGLTGPDHPIPTPNSVDTWFTLVQTVGVFTTEFVGAETSVGFAAEIGLYIILAVLVLFFIFLPAGTPRQNRI